MPYGQRQLFWISAANVWCAKYRPKALKIRVLTGVHSPDMFRVQGPFSNMHEFARDFSCPRGSNMNPEDKCQVWWTRKSNRKLLYRFQYSGFFIITHLKLIHFLHHFSIHFFKTTSKTNWNLILPIDLFSKVIGYGLLCYNFTFKLPNSKNTNTNLQSQSHKLKYLFLSFNF